MIKVGVRDLKNQLSLYLDYVKGGQKVLVTEYNQAIAEISVPQEQAQAASLAEKLKQLSARGEVILAQRNVSAAKPPKTLKNTPALNWRAVYNQTRSDRF
jgi:antitoxin (DNA-binding transcriptional repressor) of toxin-antitoxin stability system